MISVVIPLYNKAPFIARTIESVLSQSLQEFEIVVVNDGSTDNSAEVVASIDDERIRIINQDNMGVSAARNIGIQQARYEWIALLDADDLWRRDSLQTQWDLHLKYPECDLCACDYEMHDHTGRVTPMQINGLPFAEVDGVLTNYFEVASQSNPPICSSAVMARRSAFIAVGGFPKGVTNGEDLIVWASLAVRYKIAYSRCVVAIYMLREGYGLGSKPRNIPQGNVVGERLESLINEAGQQREALRSYIGFWYKIRANIFLRGEERYNAIVNSIRVLRYRPADPKGYIYLLLCFMPSCVVSYLFRRYNDKKD